MARIFIGSALVVVLATAAHAQALLSPAEPRARGPAPMGIPRSDPSSAVSPSPVVGAAGWRCGEGRFIHPIFGLGTAFVSNVFYPNLDEQPAGVLRLMGQLSTASLNQARLAANLGEGSPDDASSANVGSFEYQASVRVSYDQMLSSSDV